MKRVIYPATRAVEHAGSLPGITPIRMFPVLWQVWRVDTTAEVYERQDFEIIDHFIVRAIEEGGLHNRAELARFLSLPTGLLARCLRFLILIGHVIDTAAGLHLTDLGRMSVREGIRYVASTSRQTILIERQTGWPLPRSHYDADVRILDSPEIEEDQLADRSRFMPVFSLAQFDPRIIPWLENHPQRAEFNLPGQLRNLQKDGTVGQGYLPSYVIETTDGKLLAYSNVDDGRDEFLERVCTKTSIENLVEAEGVAEPERVWRKWLAESSTYGGGELKRLPRGLWQVVLGAGAFGDPPKIPWTRIGSFQFRDNHIIQIWCADEDSRSIALKDRALGISTLPEISTLKDLQRRVRELAARLQVPEVSIEDLLRHARMIGDDIRLDRLDRLARATS